MEQVGGASTSTSFRLAGFGQQVDHRFMMALMTVFPRKSLVRGVAHIQTVMPTTQQKLDVVSCFAIQILYDYGTFNICTVMR